MFYAYWKFGLFFSFMACLFLCFLILSNILDEAFCKTKRLKSVHYFCRKLSLSIDVWQDFEHASAEYEVKHLPGFAIY